MKDLQKILKKAKSLRETLQQECGSYENELCIELIKTIENAIKNKQKEQ